MVDQTQSRAQQIEAFLAGNGLAGAERIDMGGDASTRRYERVIVNGKSFILMDAPLSRDAIDGNLWTPDMDETQRRAVGHDAMRWRAGSRIDAFVCINGWLEENGFSVPHVHAFDVQAGLALLEDMGDGQYWTLLEKGGATDETAMYEAATDALIRLDQLTPPSVLRYETASWQLMPFDRLVIMTEAEMFPEWYIERHCGQKLSAEAMADYQAAWDGIAQILQTRADRLVTRDYQSPNLMWLPEREGLRRAGILDHQDALLSHPAFNLMFLLNDPRRDVPEAIQQSMLKRYFAAVSVDRDDFMTHFALHQVLQAFRIAGIFCRLNYRDGKPGYMVHVPRMERYIRKGLAHPACAQLKEWLDRYLPGFTAQVAA